MKRIELIGVSAVGKTTLYNKLADIPPQNRPYATLKDAYKRAAINHEVPLKNLNLWAYRQLLKNGMFKNKSRGLARTVVDSLWKKRRRNYQKRYQSFEVSNEIMLEYLKSLNCLHKSCRELETFKLKTDEYLMLDQQLPETCFVLIDEGMLHWHPGITEYADKNFTMDDLKQDEALNPAGIIFCELPGEMIYHHAVKRKNRGVHTFGHSTLNDEELREHIEISVDHHNQKISRYEDHNIPVLRINTREKIDSNKTKIDDFVLGLKGV